MNSVFHAITLFFFLCLNSAFGQSYRMLQTEMYGIQGFGSFVKTSYTADLVQFAGTVSCDEFTSGNGNGLGFGIIGEIPVSNSLSVSGGLGVYDRGGVLKTQSSFPIRYDQSSNGFTQSIMENSITTDMSFLEIQFDARYILFEQYAFAFRVLGGMRFGFPVSGTYLQTSTILQPDGAGFIVGDKILQSRELSQGSISTFSGLQTGAIIGIEPMLRVSPSMHITASINYDIPLSSALHDASLQVGGIRGQIGIRYSMRTFAPSPNTP